MPAKRSGSAASYTILFIRDGRAIRQFRWESGLASAETYARNHMAIRKADRVEIRDEKGALLFNCAPLKPEVIDAACIAKQETHARETARIS